MRSILVTFAFVMAHECLHEAKLVIYEAGGALLDS